MAYVIIVSILFLQVVARYRSFHAEDQYYEAGRSIPIGAGSGITACVYTIEILQDNK